MNKLIATMAAGLLLAGLTAPAFAQEAPAANAPVPNGPMTTTNGPDDSQPLGDAPAGGFVPIPLPDGCSAYLTQQPMIDPSDKSSIQPQGRQFLQITAHVNCNGQDTPVASLPQATLDAACADSLTKYQAQTPQKGMILTAKDYLCPKLDDPFFLN